MFTNILIAAITIIITSVRELYYNNADVKNNMLLWKVNTYLSVVLESVIHTHTHAMLVDRQTRTHTRTMRGRIEARQHLTLLYWEIFIFLLMYIFISTKIQSANGFKYRVLYKVLMNYLRPTYVCIIKPDPHIDFFQVESIL